MRAHDLLWLNAPLNDAMPDLPAWSDPGWPVVVRRALAPVAGQVPVGVRGHARHQRHAGWIDAGQVKQIVTPEMLAGHAGTDPAPDGPVAGRQDNDIRARRESAASSDAPACLRTLAGIRPQLDAAGLAWGPTGATGFWLACGAPVLHAGSDLDLVVRAPQALSEDTIALLKALSSSAACRLDIQIDTGEGAFALTEWLAGRRRILLKTAAGPRLVTDPWAMPAPAAAPAREPRSAMS